MKNIRLFLSENFHFLVEKCSIYLDKRVFVMYPQECYNEPYYNDFMYSVFVSRRANIQHAIFCNFFFFFFFFFFLLACPRK